MWEKSSNFNEVAGSSSQKCRRSGSRATEKKTKVQGGVWGPGLLTPEAESMQSPHAGAGRTKNGCGERGFGMANSRSPGLHLYNFVPYFSQVVLE